MTNTPTDVSAWVGRTERGQDPFAETQAQAAAAAFDDRGLVLAQGDELPRLWHWFYFLSRAPQSALDRDGHPTRGGFLPPISLPRRMFAGARVRWHAPLQLGVPATRDGEIVSVTHKEGKSGRLAFVTVRYRIAQSGVMCLEEEQDIVYREPGAPASAPAVRPWSPVDASVATRELRPDSRLLFRFSALTFNAHRIHYDREYAVREEGYPGLVVHGPLMALQLLQFAEAQERDLRRATPRAVSAFSFRGLAPVFDTGPLRLRCTVANGQSLLEAERSDGVIALRAEATFG